MDADFQSLFYSLGRSRILHTINTNPINKDIILNINKLLGTFSRRTLNSSTDQVSLFETPIEAQIYLVE